VDGLIKNPTKEKEKPGNPEACKPHPNLSISAEELPRNRKN
jgi:hypothetical protein